MGVVEGLNNNLNNNVKLTMRKSHGFRAGKAIGLALYHGLEAIPEPKPTHEFCCRGKIF